MVALDGFPGKVHSCRPFFERADSVRPAVAGSEVSSGVADYRQAESFQGCQHVGPEAVLIGERRTRLINAAVYTASEVFGESAENIRVDIAYGPFRVNSNLIHNEPL